jgi:hypothetical protein
MSSQTIKKTNSIARNPAREAGETIIEGTIVKKNAKNRRAENGAGAGG